MNMYSFYNDECIDGYFFAAEGTLYKEKWFNVQYSLLRVIFGKKCGYSLYFENKPNYGIFFRYNSFRQNLYIFSNCNLKIKTIKTYLKF